MPLNKKFGNFYKRLKLNVSLKTIISQISKLLQQIVSPKYAAKQKRSQKNELNEVRLKSFLKTIY